MLLVYAVVDFLELCEIREIFVSMFVIFSTCVIMWFSYVDV
jgi:hypothetical protein